MTEELTLADICTEVPDTLAPQLGDLRITALVEVESAIAWALTCCILETTTFVLLVPTTLPEESKAVAEIECAPSATPVVSQGQLVEEPCANGFPSM